MSHRIIFWNGNKSAARKAYEVELLQSILTATEADYGNWSLQIDDQDYPSAEDEGCILERGVDLLVTVAGNKKFKGKDKISIDHAIIQGLLGYRLLVINQADRAHFAAIKEVDALKEKSIGIPETWADADLFRHNDYRVVEKGSFNDLFRLLKERAFDYTALGANEIETTFLQHAEPLGGLTIEPNLLIYYPFPLVFYVSPKATALAQRVEQGLKMIQQEGQFDVIFNRYYGDTIHRLKLRERTVFPLQNPDLPQAMKHFRSTLLD